MKRIANRGLALLMAVLMCIGLLAVPGNHNHAHAADFEYKTSGSYIYNWGTREVVADELSPNAQAFYTGDYTYDKLSQLAGGTGTTDAPNSALYNALKTLMTSKHTYETSYDATRPLFQYTDCENNGNPSTISSFYSGLAVGPAWDSGATWNREHTWPNSKGLGGNDENDIMMLRPTEKSENGSRGNKAYGESDSFYNPNSVSNGIHDLRGDVARIFLYVYVRWGNTAGNGQYTAWGSSGVMESLDVLIKWMAEDPVDTWELGRNDSVQSITGTRNVFVDYPELAFKLFGKAVPTTTITPAGGHNLVAGAVTQPGCTTEGSTTYTCSCGCGYTYQLKVAAKGHNYVDGVCSCGATEGAYGVIDTPVVGTAYKFGMIQENKSTTDVYYLKGGMSSYYMATTTDKNAAIDVYLEETTGGYYLYTMLNGTKTYINMVVSGTHVNGSYEAAASTVYTYDADSKTVVANVDGADYWFGTRNDNTYTTVGPVKTAYNGFYCKFYGMAAGDPGTNPGGGEGSDPTPGGGTESWTLVTDVADLQAGNQIIIAAESYDKALSTEQKSNNRGAAAITKDGDTVTFGDDVQIITLEAGNKANTFAFNVGNGYLYAASSSKNYLRTETNLSDNSSWSITIDASGVATVKAQGTNTRNWLRFNLNNGTNLFSVYTSGQENIAIYKLAVSGSGCQHSWNDADCTNPKTCSLCGATEGEALDHNYENGSCTYCGEPDPNAGGSTESKTVRIYYPAGNSYITSTASGSKLKPGNERAAAIWTMTAEGEYYSFSCDGKYLTSGATGNSLTLSSNLTDYALWTLEEASNGCYYLRNKAAVYNGKSQYVEFYSNLFTTYGFNASNTRIYTFQLKDAVTPDKCTHDWDAATCTEPKTCKICYTTEGEALGHDWADATCTAPKTCKVCSTTSGSALGHNYEGGSCTVCGAEDPNKGLTLADITFNNTSKRTEFSNTKQVWEENGITVTNNKAASTSNVANYSNPARFYAASELIIEYPGMVKIEVTCNTSSYATALKNSIPANSATVTVSGKVVTITLPAAADSFKVAKLSAQVRVNSITVYAACEHEEWNDATCTSPKTCKNCGIAEGEALGHNWSNATCLAPKTCQREGCGLIEGSALAHDYLSLVIVQPTCNEAGTRLVACVNGCDESYVMSIPATGHKMFNGTCTVCGATTETPDPVAVCGGSVNCPVHAFSDLKADSWYHDGLHFCLENGLIEGVSDDKFAPQENITRAQLVFALWKLEGSPVADCAIDFSDVAEGQWYTEAIRWATSQNLVNGYGNGKFGVDDALTREQFATVLYRYAYYEGRYLNFDGDLTLFADGAQVSDYAVRALQWACGEGLIQGVSSEKLDPQGTATRAQAATILYRFCEK